MQKSLGFWIVVAFPLIVFAQPQGPDTVWTRTFGGSGNEAGASVIATSDGNYLVSGGGQMMLAKYTPSGDTLWTRTSSLSVLPLPHRLKESPPGEYCVLGTGGQNSAHFDGQGFLLWSRFIPMDGGGSDQNGQTWWHSNAITWAGSNGYLRGEEVTWVGNVPPYYAHSTLMFRLDSTGFPYLQQYVRSVPMDVLETTDSGYVATGNTFYSDDGPMLIERYPYGYDHSPQWSQSFGSYGSDSGEVVVMGSDNSCFVGDRHFICRDSSSVPVYDITVSKLVVSSGQVTWSHNYGGMGDDRLGNILPTADGGFVLCGRTNSTGAGDYDVYLLRTDGSGNVLWEGTYGGTQRDWGMDLCRAENGGYVIVGGTQSFGAGGSDIWVIKTAPDPVLAAEPKSEPLSARFTLDANYPNPFNPATQIAFDLPSTGRAMVKVFDVTGRAVITLADGPMAAGHHELSFDGSHLSSGVYFYQLTHGGQTQTRKMLLLR